MDLAFAAERQRTASREQAADYALAACPREETEALNLLSRFPTTDAAKMIADSRARARADFLGEP